jgi:TolB-like protein
MRFFFATLMIVASAFAQDAGITGLAAKLGHQLASRQLKSVAVLQFTNTQNYDTQLSAHLVDQIIREMGTQVQGIEVTGRTQSDALLRELRLVDAPEISSKDLETIATRLSVDAIVAGTFNAAGQTVAIDATIFDGKTSYIVGGASAKLDRADLDRFLVDRKGPASAAVVAIPSGMEIDVKLNEKVDAAESRNGKTVSATLENDIVVRNVLLAKKGTEVKLHATSPDGMELRITLASMTLTDQRNVLLSSDQIIKPSTMIRPKGATGSVPENAPAQPQPGEATQSAQLAFHLKQDVR